MKCKKCKCACTKAGKQKNGIQKWHCKTCRKYQQKRYSYRAYTEGTDSKIVALLKEGCGIRSIARLLQISTTTLIKRIKLIGRNAEYPKLRMNKEYELDEIRTYVQRKSKLIWVAYAIQKDTREVMAISIGRRTNKTLKIITDTLSLSRAKKIFTDKLNSYRSLISKKIHSTKYRGTNYIERKHLNLRTHLKRLNRRTICFSKSITMLIACIKIYCWC